MGSFTNLQFDESTMNDDFAFEINRPLPRTSLKPFTNLVFSESSLHWDEFKENTPRSPSKPNIFTNVVFPDDEMDDYWGQFECNRPPPMSHNTSNAFTNVVFAEGDLSDDDFGTNWPPPKSFTNLTFPPPGDSDDDMGPSYPSGRVTSTQVRNARYNRPHQYTAHRPPPQRPGLGPDFPARNDNLHRNDSLQEVLLQSLLDNPNNTATREDLAMLAQVIYNQHAQTQRTQTSQARQIEDLRGQIATEASVVPGAAGRKSNEKVSRPPTTVHLQRLIRKAAFQLMGRVPSQNKDPTPITSATPEDIKRFLANPTNPALGPQADQLVLDFNDGSGGGSFWNKKATAIFTELFLEDEDQYTAREVSKAFRTHILQLKNQFKDYTQFLDDLATMGDQADLLTAREEDVYSSRMSRRRNLLHRRSGACQEFCNNKHPDIMILLELWKAMPLEAISGDETDHHNGQSRYVITTLPWRAAWVRQWMLVFDRLHLSTRFKGRRAKAGAFPHIRVQGNARRVDRECTTVPAGLPKNFYCPRWLSQQSDQTIQDLEMQEPIDTNFSVETIRVALACRNVVSHRTPPIPLDEIPQDLIVHIIDNDLDGPRSDEEMNMST